jgi:hypothetical protein
VTNTAFQTSNSAAGTSGSNAFVAKVSMASLVATTTTVTSSANPATAGATVTFTADVDAASGSTLPAGSVTFVVDGSTASTVTLGATGTATFATSSLAAGTHSITASYAGSSSFSASAGNGLTQTISEPVTAAPVFSPAVGTYTAAQSVKLSDATSGATIYYTTNGAGPSTSSAIYSGAISVGASEEFEAIAVAPGYTNSGLARADYTIAPPPSGPVVPPNATASSDLQMLDTWHFNHDAGTPGTAVGATSLVSTPSLSGSTRQFASSYTGAGGEIYSVSYADDTASMNFVYDAQVWIEAGSSIANLEMDSNQVTANGQTVIYAFQCDGYAHVWDYSGPDAHWVKSIQPCNLANWSKDAWHHVQISYSRDDSGNVTYHSVWLDGTEQVINETVPSSFALGWQVGVVQTQFQMDGLGASGSSTVYLDNLTISRW